MKKQFLSFSLAVCLFLSVFAFTSCSFSPSAASDVGPAAEVETVHSLSVAVALQKNGDAIITEEWDMTLLQGTEWYLKLYNLGEGSQVKNLTVWDETGKKYKNDNEWEIEGNLTDKKNRSGILPLVGGDFEVCWGIGKYGRHRYTAEYTITNFVKSYTDYDGFNYNFVNDGSSLSIQQASLAITYQSNTLQPENTRFWSLGYEGETSWDNNQITAKTSAPLLVDNSFVAIVQFEKGLFKPATNRNETLATVVETHFTEELRGSGQGGPVTTAMGKETIHGVDISVLLETNGNATITEVWDVTVLKGTEWYLGFYDKRNFNIYGVAIQDETGTHFESVFPSRFNQNKYDTNEKKENIFTEEDPKEGEDGYKLRWSVDSYGRHQYSVSYKISDFVKKYNDYTGFVYNFIGGPADIPSIENVRVVIEKEEAYFDNVALSSSNTFYWGEGFEGTVRMEGETVIAQSNAPQRTDSPFLLAFQFENGTFDEGMEQNDSNLSSLLYSQFSDNRFYDTATGTGTVQVFGSLGLAEVHSVDILLQPQKDGTVLITETWDMTPYSGTEWYTGLSRNDHQDNIGLSVWDETGRTYLVENDLEEDPAYYTWKTERPLEEKTAKCGYSYSNICIRWGLHELGVRHQYTVQYSVTGLFGQMKNADVLSITLLAQHPGNVIPKATVTVASDEAPFTKENATIYANGYDGTLFFEEGKIIAATTQKLPPNGHIALNLGFSPSIFALPPSDHSDYTFNDKRAFRSSNTPWDIFTSNTGSGGYITTQKIVKTSSFSYRKVQEAIKLVGLLFCASLVLYFLYRIFRRVHRLYTIYNYYKKRGLSLHKAKRRSYLKEMDYCRSVPFLDSPSTNIWILLTLGMRPSEGDIISAFIMGWAQSGRVKFVPCAKDGGNTQEVVFVENPPPPSTPFEPMEENLYNILLNASGADRILSPKEINQWAKNKTNGGRIVNWKLSIQYSSKQYAEQNNAADELLFPHLKKKDVLSDSGVVEAKKLLGLKHYLLDFTLVHERMPPEVTLWREYLVYATLFGIADRVSSSFATLYPQYFRLADSTLTPAASYETVRRVSYSTANSFDSVARNITGSSSGVRRSSYGSGSSSGGGSSSSSSSDRGGGSSSGGGGRGGDRR